MSKDKATEISLNTNTGRAKDRPKRIPLHERRVLDSLARPGFVRRFVNETYGRVEAFMDAGWMIVTNDHNEGVITRMQDGTAVGSQVRRVVNKGRDSNSQTAVLMEIPEEYFHEDQQAKQYKVDEIEATYDPKKFSKDQKEVNYGTLKQEIKDGE